VRDFINLRGYRVIVTAERIVRTELWNMEARVDETLHDTTHSDYPEETADVMIAQINAEFY
jgi:hypothetical protein